MNEEMISIEDRIESVKVKFENQISIDEVSKMVSQVMSSIDGDVAINRLHLNDEIQSLLTFIEQTKTELSFLRPKEYGENKLPEVSNELNAIVSATEVAAEQIMDAADEIGEIAEKCGDEIKGQLENISTKLFEASSFQDITGQRITKIYTTINHLEERLSALAEAIGDKDVDIVQDDDASFDKDYETMANEDFLHGPQLKEEAQDQAAIDALFDDF